MSETMSTEFDVRSEAKGAHWIAWIVRAGEDSPDGSVVIVGQTQEEAESHARQWAAQQSAS
ncbi:MAG: hypothetical protein QF463_08980 [Vicinamibacterales bacterium]|jgi:hypothetical protein|nr:hypothetical protein [Acidobacteriota bacterium]MDP6373014.1 hypothetical protein [Vicinamibacterales bacterium]MDP6609187.1 hypothetical protein [Vicinamibacterales bacterium]HAK57050.1 hypothetical protein [Acidobacteriota bacterium]|tara:strand:- start:1327 stop:1509 length:183 start_codon:yes stop_codon:yes gene_type:complete